MTKKVKFFLIFSPIMFIAIFLAFFLFTHYETVLSIRHLDLVSEQDKYIHLYDLTSDNTDILDGTTLYSNTVDSQLNYLPETEVVNISFRVEYDIQPNEIVAFITGSQAGKEVRYEASLFYPVGDGKYATYFPLHYLSHLRLDFTDVQYSEFKVYDLTLNDSSIPLSAYFLSHLNGGYSIDFRNQFGIPLIITFFICHFISLIWTALESGNKDKENNAKKQNSRENV